MPSRPTAISWQQSGVATRTPGACTCRLQQEGRTVVLVSHDMRDVAALATRVVVLRGGRKAEDRPAAGLTPDALFHLVMGGAR